MKSFTVFSRNESITLKSKHIRFAAITGIITIALVILYFYNPVSSKIYPPSPFRAITGLFCPGCGTLRGLHQLLHGHFLAALELNPLMVISLPFMVYAYLSYAKKVLTGRRLPSVYIKSKWIWLLLKAIVAYWILRNIPIAPFSWLAP
jgi:hypothetical protein